MSDFLRDQFPKSKSQGEADRTYKWARNSFLAGVAFLAGYDMLLDRFIDDSRGEAPIERVEEADTQTLEELDLDKGTLVYDDTSDTYIVYVDDTEANPADEAGWYEFDLNKLVAPAETEE